MQQRRPCETRRASGAIRHGDSSGISSRTLQQPINNQPRHVATCPAGSHQASPATRRNAGNLPAIKPLSDVNSYGYIR